MAWTTPLTWSGVPTATQMNQQVRDNPTVLLGPMESAEWQMWIPGKRFHSVQGGATFALRDSTAAGGVLQYPCWNLSSGGAVSVATMAYLPIAGFLRLKVYYAPSSLPSAQQVWFTRLLRVDAGDQIDDATWDYDQFTAVSAAGAADDLHEQIIFGSTLYATPGFYKVVFQRDGGSGADTAGHETWFIGMNISVTLE